MSANLEWQPCCTPGSSATRTWFIDWMGVSEVRDTPHQTGHGDSCISDPTHSRPIQYLLHRRKSGALYWKQRRNSSWLSRCQHHYTTDRFAAHRHCLEHPVRLCVCRAKRHPLLLGTKRVRPTWGRRGNWKWNPSRTYAGELSIRTSASPEQNSQK